MNAISVSVLDQALAIASAGWRVVLVHTALPDGCSCGRPNCERKMWGKHPIRSGWEKGVDEQELRDQYVRLRFCPNVGIVLGKQDSGRYIVSIDSDNGDRMEELTSELGPLPASSQCRTPRGWHLFFSVPGGSVLKNITGLCGAPGVDMKASKGQVVVLGRNSAGEYTGFDPTATVAELPDTWLRAITPRTTPVAGAGRLRLVTPSPSGGASDLERARAYVAKIDPAISGVGGHDQTHYAACQIVRMVSSHADRWELLLGYNRTCKPPWSAAELEHKLEDAEKKETYVGLPDRPKPATKPASEYATSEYATSAGANNAACDNHKELIMIDGKPASIAENVARMLETYPGGPPRHNTFSDRYEWPCGTQITDTDALKVQGWLYSHPPHQLVRANKAACIDGISIAAKKTTFHPVQDYLKALVWDGNERVSALLHTYMRAADSDYSRSASACFMVSVVARAMVPGCKVDTVLVLEGEQGTGKTSALTVLASQPWFRNTHIPLATPVDKYNMLKGALLYELAEFDSYRPSQQADLKAFITSSNDEYSQKYETVAVKRPRCGVFVATTNRYDYLGDATGARRFVCVKTGRIDLASLSRDRDQLWAEAYYMYTNGRQWHMADDMQAVAISEASDRYQHDTWQQELEVRLRHVERVTTFDALTLLGVEVPRQDRSHQIRVADVMRRMGWERRRVMVGSVRMYYYHNPVNSRAVGHSPGHTL